MRAAWRYTFISAFFLILLCVSGSSAEQFRFVAMADSRGNSNGVNDAVLSGIVDLLLLDDPAFLVFPGDLVNGSSMDSILASQLNHWRDIMAPVYASDMYGSKIYAGPGNHEIRHAGSETVWQTIFDDLPWNGPAEETYMTYSFDYLNAHFIMLNTNRAGLSHTVNYAWLADDLAATAAEHIFVFGHEPAFPVGPHLGSSLDYYPDQRDDFWQLLADYAVAVYFTGHEHLYNHSEVAGVHQVITGTCGAPIYSGYGGDFYHYALVTVDGPDVFIEIIDDTGTVRDFVDLCVNGWVRVVSTAAEYATPQEAYDAAGEYDTLQSGNAAFDGDLHIDLPKTVALEAGYDCDYSAVTGYTTLRGDVTVTDGVLIIDIGRIVIENIT